jgi:oligoribonuclease NrnB/cAMP/cGMP phosphodiesterase (DHH superfamily)
MDESLIDDSHIPLSRRTRLPGAGFFYPDSLDEARADERVREAVAGASAVVVADGDADGLGCVALVRAAHDASLDVSVFEEAIEARLADRGADGDEPGGGESPREAAEAAVEAETDAAPVALVTSGPYDLGESLGRVAEYLEPGAAVYVCDICPDEYDDVGADLEAVVDRASSVRWFDHHQWDPEVRSKVEAAGVSLVVGESDEVCSTDVAFRSLDGAFPGHLRELAEVTRDHDLWEKEDPRSDDLADYAHWTDPEEYVAIVGRYGPDLPRPVRSFLEDRRVEKRQRIEAAVDRARIERVGPWRVAVTYGRCSQNEVADQLREAGADAAVVVKPAGSASIRGSDGFEQCHEVAAQVEGGGHPRAAGCKPDLYEDMLDYAHHWTTEGSAAKAAILQAFRRVAEDVDAGTDADAETGGTDADAETGGTDADAAADANSGDGDGTGAGTQ